MVYVLERKYKTCRKCRVHIYIYILFIDKCIIIVVYI